MRFSLWPVIVLGGALGGCSGDAPVQRQNINGDARTGRNVVENIGCGVCHVIPGVRGPGGRTGPSLAGFGARTLLAGTLPNQPDRLMQFVRDAPSVDPRTAMPKMPLSEQEARDVTAFLYTLR